MASAVKSFYLGTVSTLERLLRLAHHTVSIVTKGLYLSSAFGIAAGVPLTILFGPWMSILILVSLAVGAGSWFLHGWVDSKLTLVNVGTAFLAMHGRKVREVSERWSSLLRTVETRMGPDESARVAAAVNQQGQVDLRKGALSFIYSMVESAVLEPLWTACAAPPAIGLGMAAAALGLSFIVPAIAANILIAIAVLMAAVGIGAAFITWYIYGYAKKTLRRVLSITPPSPTQLQQAEAAEQESAAAATAALAHRSPRHANLSHEEPAVIGAVDFSSRNGGDPYPYIPPSRDGSVAAAASGREL